MRFLELDFESARTLEGADPPLQGLFSVASPTDDDLWTADRPDGAKVRILRWRTGAPPAEVTPGPANFFPRILADDGQGRVLIVGAGGPENAAMFEADGREARRFSLGEEIADLSFDPDGNLVVLRQARRGRRALLDRYGEEGDRVVRDPQIERIAGHTHLDRGAMLLIQRDGTLWMNLCEKYTADGELLDAIDPATTFGPGRVSADLLGWDGILVLSEKGVLTALLPRGVRRAVRVPEKIVQQHLGRGLNAALDLLVTRGEWMDVVATEQARRLRFRILSE